MELQLKDLESVEKRLDRVKKALSTGDKSALKELEYFKQSSRRSGSSGFGEGH